MKQPRFAIVNTYDAPEKRNVVQWIDDLGYCYMARAIDPNLKEFDGMRPRRPTPIEDFGFAVQARNEDAVFIQVNDSIATYEDGKPRKWQGTETKFTLPLVRGARKRKREPKP